MVQTRTGSPEQPYRVDATSPIERRSYYDRPADEERRRVYVALAPDATAGPVVAVLDRLAGDRRPVLVTGEIPGNPGGPPTAPPPNPLGDQIGEAFGFGGLGLRGTGRGGGIPGGTIGLGNLGGIGQGGGGGPRVRDGVAEVRGSLPSEVIRRVIRRHINEVRHCYEQRLAQNPSLAGRVGVRFVIGPTGRVISAEVESSTMNDGETEACIAAAVRRWTFPAPDGGGIVAVSYPFVFTSSP
jgi:TonB family protein